MADVERAQGVMSKLETYKENYTKHEKLSNSTDVDEK